MKVPSDAGSPDIRTGVNNYWVARSLLQSILLPADVEVFNAESGAFRIQDSYDFVLQISDDLFILLDCYQLLLGMVNPSFMLRI